MKSQSPDLEVVLGFVQGTLSVSEFVAHLYESSSIDEFLGGHQCGENPAYVGTSLPAFLLQLNFDDPGDVLSAQGALEDLLLRTGVAFQATGEYGDLFEIILDAQPSWLKVDSEWVQQHLFPRFGESGAADLKPWLRREFLKRFRYVSEPPSWIQSPDWPIVNGVPLLFLGEVKIAGYFHDEAMAYVFHNPENGSCETIIQVA